MPQIQVRRGNLDEHDPWNRHRLGYDMGLWDFSYTYAVLTLPINQIIDGVKEFLNFPVLPVGFPTEDAQAANKFYVDYTSQNAVTFENLFSNGDVGVNSDQVARGDHSHVNLPSDDQKDALDTAQNPSAGNPFTTWNQFSDHHTRHENNGPDEISLSGLEGGPVTLYGIRVSITTVSTTPYSVLNTDVHLSVDSSLSVIVINLPAITSINHGQRFTIKDGYSSAGTNNIQITPNGTDQIDNGGAGVSFDLVADDEVIDVIANNTTKNWEIAP
jgi:hypothetical protein